jgi:chromosome segregation ATPase
MIKEFITDPGGAIGRVVEIPGRIEADIRSGLETLREIREQLQQIGDVPLAMLNEMSAVKDAMRETNVQLEAMNEQMGQVLRLSAPIQRVHGRAVERRERIRSRLGLGDNEEGPDDAEPDDAPPPPKPRAPRARKPGTPAP